MRDTATITVVDAAGLRKLERRARLTAQRALAASEARNAAMQQALDDGMSQAEIARALGISRERVGQLLGRPG